MKILTGKNVYEAAKERIRWIYNEFPNVITAFSGGKDSTVCLHLCLEVAKEKNRFPQKVLFIDQEGEYQATNDYVKHVMNLPEVEPWWFQVPIKLFNATSTKDTWLYCWDEKKKNLWMRPKDPLSIKKNEFGTDRFANAFTKIVNHYFDEKTCVIGGVRTEESLSRYVGLTSAQTYKHITYGKILNRQKKQYTFYPIYDWGYRDVWKYIHDNKIRYNKIYDYMYQYGVPILNMRVSNLHHETAVNALFFLQEFEPKTWNKLTNRLSGINTAGVMQSENFFIHDLPYMFKNWKEYRDFLLDHLIEENGTHEKFKNKFDKLDKRYSRMHHLDSLYKACIQTLMCNDYYFTKLNNWESDKWIVGWRKSIEQGQSNPQDSENKYITG